MAKDPLAVIRAKPEESFILSSHMWDTARRYREAKIWDRFHIDFLTYSGLPLPESQLLDRLSIEVFAKGELEDIKIRNEAQEAQQRDAEAKAAQAAAQQGRGNKP